ncbi:MAG: glycerol-3-phosphate dehydrogenase/oxidase [Dehalococcoidia bacterium]|nr:MAG: glycerol-3-phosphate dehydrogenase/oxidase [Dehalococcoidia bacterium]
MMKCVNSDMPKFAKASNARTRRYGDSLIASAALAPHVLLRFHTPDPRLRAAARGTVSAIPAISAIDRQRTLEALERERFDVAIIGGGITGAGLAHRAAASGLSVALLEAEDFASGTSSRSSKLIHGGLRYLAMGEVRLVRETALERKHVHRLAPHLAERRWMVMPMASRANLLAFRAAITLYEKLGAVERADLHHNWSPRDLEREEPLLDRSHYPYACAYREYVTDDARLVLANARVAASHGARLLNHAPATALSVDGGRATGIEAACRLSGRTVRVRARCVVNAAGPWVDAVRQLEAAEAPSTLHLSKGVHVVLPASRVPLRNLVILSAADKRMLFAIPRGQVVFIGTTDTTYPCGPRVWPGVTSKDVNYLLEPLARYLTGEPVTAADVITAWSGLRPLVTQPGKKPTETSRADEVVVGPAGVVTVAGGKLTGYRPTVARVLRTVAAELGTTLSDDPPEELPGGAFDGDLPKLAGRLVDEFSVSQTVAARLAQLYGAEAQQVAAAGLAPLAPHAPVIEGEVDWSVRNEAAARVEDVVYRRTRAALYEPEAARAIVEPVASRMAQLLGWDAARTHDEVEATRARLAADLQFGSDA